MYNINNDNSKNNDNLDKNHFLILAKLGLTAAMTVSLTLTMENWLKNPFGIKYLEIGNFNLLAAINVITAVPSFSESEINILYHMISLLTIFYVNIEILRI